MAKSSQSTAHSTYLFLTWHEMDVRQGTMKIRLYEFGCCLIYWWIQSVVYMDNFPLLLCACNNPVIGFDVQQLYRIAVAWLCDCPCSSVNRKPFNFGNWCFNSRCAKFRCRSTKPSPCSTVCLLFSNKVISLNCNQTVEDISGSSLRAVLSNLILASYLMATAIHWPFCEWSLVVVALVVFGSGALSPDPWAQSLSWSLVTMAVLVFCPYIWPSCFLTFPLFLVAHQTVAGMEFQDHLTVDPKILSCLQ